MIHAIGFVSLAENTEQPANQENHDNGSEPDACATASAPAGMTVISAASSKNQNQENDDDD
jgi:hypothetical protein